MKESIRKAYKVVDSSQVYLLHLIEQYIETLYSIGFDSRRFKINETLSLNDVDGYTATLNRLKTDLKKLIEELLDRVDSISYEATDEEDISSWSRAAFLSSVIYGSTYDKRVSKILNTLTEEISKHIRASASHNLTKKSAISSFRKWLTSSKKKDIEAEILKAMDSIPGASSMYRLIYLFDDMVNRGYHEANIHYWKQAGIELKQIVAVVDNLTCSDCLALDGQIFPVEESILPVHGSCRCEEYPVT